MAHLPGKAEDLLTQRSRSVHEAVTAGCKIPAHAVQRQPSIQARHRWGAPHAQPLPVDAGWSGQ